MLKQRKGNRPSYINAADSKNAVSLYRQFKKDLSKLISQDVLSGEFGADMQVGLVNDGPVTIIIDTKIRNNYFFILSENRMYVLCLCFLIET